MARRVVAVSDFCDPNPPSTSDLDAKEARERWKAVPPATPASAPVIGGYLERLPLACVAAGLADTAEIWRFAGDDAHRDAGTHHAGLTRRTLRADCPAPYGSVDALAHVAVHGVPEILCVWGLGVDEAVMTACRDSIRIYNSIDAPALRIPPEVSRHVDLFLTGAEWQSDEIRARHPDALCAVLPIGPEFASDETFFPTGAAKDYDVVYVAATQPYKRHDLLLDALAQLPGRRALCVVGYGHLTEDLRAEAVRRGLDVDWAGPFDHAGVNAAMNRARVGVVCGVEDGAPAILTEYMLAGLPVLANARLVCGRQYIRPDTGLIAAEADFAAALDRLIDTAASYDPRPVVQRNWTWPHSVRRLAGVMRRARMRKREMVA